MSDDGSNGSSLRVASEGLVDRDLLPEARHASRMAGYCLIENMAHRLSTVFCGRGDYDVVAHMWPEISGGLLIETLPAFVHSLGGQIAYAARFVSNTHCLPEQTSVTVNGRQHRIMTEGSVCVLLPAERLVVSVTEVDRDDGKNRVVVLDSNGNATAFYEKWVEFAKQHNYLRGRPFFADGTIISNQRKFSWDSIQLPEATRQVIMTHVCGFLRNRVKLREMGVRIKRGLILSGQPGTGKTLLGKVLADTVDASFIWVTPRHLKSPQSFADLLHLARFVAPSVIFMEDLDLFAEERGSGQSFGLGELMNQLDGAAENEDIIVIATTNRLEVVEKALRNRPGRFDRVLELGAVDATGRFRLLREQLGSLKISDSDVDYLVDATAEYTGAQLQEVANTICIHAAEGYARSADESNVALVDRDLITAALSELKVAGKSRLGFRVA